MKKLLCFLLLTNSVQANDPDSTHTSYKIITTEIDSTLFYQTKKSAPKPHQKPNKITDFQTVKELLKGIVKFGDEYSEQNVNEIHFKNGKKFKNQDICNFIAYYLDEEILLCEGGHTIDVSFNLKNGKHTEEVGNPEYFNPSPNSKFRLNAHFGGQECYNYFIEQNINGEFQKVIQLDEEFEKQTKLWLCTIGEVFWVDDNTLFLSEFGYNESGIEHRYFKVELIEN